MKFEKLLLCSTFVLMPLAVRADINTLAWDASTGRTDVTVTGYKIAYGTKSKEYATTVDVGNVLTYITPDLAGDGQTYFFAVKAYGYDVAGTEFESEYSNEVSITVGTASMRQCPCSMWDASAVPGVDVSPETDVSVELGVRIKFDIGGFINGVKFYKPVEDGNVHTATVWDVTTKAPLATATFVNESVSGWQSVKFTNPVGVTAGSEYIVSYHTENGRYYGEANYFNVPTDNAPLHAIGSSYAYGGSYFPGETWANANYWVDVLFDTEADPAPPPKFGPAIAYAGIWDDSTVPNVGGSNDTASVELGVKFKSDVDGYVVGVRFWKDAANTGTHTGTLWELGGAKLASATFTDETTSGWQTVKFAKPVAVTAGAVYIVSYHTDKGHYNCTQYAFSAAEIDKAPLHMLKDGVYGGNGVYKYGNGVLYPSDSWRSSNYWVDVLFSIY